MGPFARSNRLGRVVTETLFLIDPVQVLKRRPDVAFVSSIRWPLKRKMPATESWHVVPDLTVEVVSKTNSAYSVARKIDEYFEAGVLLVWVLYPSAYKVYVYDSPTTVRILQIGDELDGGAVLPGFRIPLSKLFDRKSPSKRKPKAE
jgi:Uma2 family endonuclease